MSRRATRTVQIGALKLGSGHPIRVQSMTTSDTDDVAATVGQIERLVAAGCELVRVTVNHDRAADDDRLSACEPSLAHQLQLLGVQQVADLRDPGQTAELNHDEGVAAIAEHQANIGRGAVGIEQNRRRPRSVANLAGGSGLLKVVIAQPVRLLQSFLEELLNSFPVVV